MNSKNLIKRILIGIIIISFIIYYAVIYIALTQFGGSIFEKDFIKIIISLILALAMDFSSYYFIILIFLGNSLSKRKIYKEKLSKNDLNSNKEYFRDVLKNYNPLELSYIDDFKLDSPKDIVAILLHLNKKGIISFNKEKRIIQYTEKNISLTESESVVLKLIKNGKVQISEYDFNNYLEIVKKECLNQELLKLDNKKISFLKLFIMILIIIFGFNYLMLFFDSLPAIAFIILIIIINIILPFVVVFYIIYLVSYNIQKTKNPYVRSEKGEEVNKKLEGLKNYLKDFSNMNERDIKDIIIWEDYLVYSVLFNQNTKIINEIYNTYFIK